VRYKWSGSHVYLHGKHAWNVCSLFASFKRFLHLLCKPNASRCKLRDTQRHKADLDKLWPSKTCINCTGLVWTDKQFALRTESKRVSVGGHSCRRFYLKRWSRQPNKYNGETIKILANIEVSWKKDKSEEFYAYFTLLKELDPFSLCPWLGLIMGLLCKTGFLDVTRALSAQNIEPPYSFRCLL